MADWVPHGSAATQHARDPCVFPATLPHNGEPQGDGSPKLGTGKAATPGISPEQALTRPDYATLMLETGYYTWHGGRDAGKAHLDFPNREVAASWTRDILGLAAHAPALNETLIPDLRACLETGDVDGFGRRLEHFVFGIAHENLQQEAGYRALLQALFLLMAVPTQSEPSNWGGRADHEVQIGHRVYVFEVKYNRSEGEALRQIRDRQYGRQHLGTGRTVTAVGLAFRRDLQTGPCLQVAQADLARLLTTRAEDDPRERRVRHPPD